MEFFGGDTFSAKGGVSPVVRLQKRVNLRALLRLHNVFRVVRHLQQRGYGLGLLEFYRKSLITPGYSCFRYRSQVARASASAAFPF